MLISAPSLATLLEVASSPPGGLGPAVGSPPLTPPKLIHWEIVAGWGVLKNRQNWIQILPISYLTLGKTSHYLLIPQLSLPAKLGWILPYRVALGIKWDNAYQVWGRAWHTVGVPETSILFCYILRIFPILPTYPQRGNSQWKCVSPCRIQERLLE